MGEDRGEDERAVTGSEGETEGWTLEVGGTTANGKEEGEGRVWDKECTEGSGSRKGIAVGGTLLDEIRDGLLDDPEFSIFDICSRKDTSSR